jgi:hypothetical protein
MRRDQLPFRGAERGITAQEDLRQLIQGLTRLGPEQDQAANTGNAFGDIDVSHSKLFFTGENGRQQSD